jgi:hypothetical protein
MITKCLWKKLICLAEWIFPETCQQPAAVLFGARPIVSGIGKGTGIRFAEVARGLILNHE